MVNNWRGDRDIIFFVAFEHDSTFCCFDTGKPMLERQGDKIYPSFDRKNPGNT